MELKLGPNESHWCSDAICMGYGVQNSPVMSKNLEQPQNYVKYAYRKSLSIPYMVPMCPRLPGCAPGLWVPFCFVSSMLPWQVAVASRFFPHDGKLLRLQRPRRRDRGMLMKKYVGSLRGLYRDFV